MALPIEPTDIPNVVNRFGTTTLQANLNQNTETSCTLVNAGNLALDGGCIQIEDEIIIYEYREGNILYNLTRAVDGTAKVSHDAGVIVTSRIVAANFNRVKSALLDLDNGKFNNPTGTTLQYIDGTGALRTFPVFSDSTTVVMPVRNAQPSQLAIPKASVVYISGESGGKLLIELADADDETKSAKTIGLTRDQIDYNDDGYVVIIGAIEDVNTQGMTAGAELWLSQTPGAYTMNKPLSPAHLVQVGFVKKVGESTTNGSLEVRIDNGYELDELHDVLIENKVNNQVLKWDSTSGLWKNATLAISDTNGLQTALDSKVDENAAITGATKTKITYDSKGLVTAGADATTDDIAEGLTNKYYPAADAAKLAGIEPLAEVNNISDTNATDLTDGGDSALHFHSSDRNRANHTGTQTAATISDFDTEVSNNASVVANTAKVSADGSINTHSDVDTVTTPPTSGQALKWNGTTWVPGNVLTGVGGANTQLQYNDNGVLGGTTGIAYTGDLNFSGTTEINFPNRIGQLINLYDARFGIGLQSGTTYMRSITDFAWHVGGVHDNGRSNPGTGGTNLAVLNDTGYYLKEGNLFVNTLTGSAKANIKGAGTTSATNTLALTNSSDENLFTMNDNGAFNGKYLAIGEYSGATRIGVNAAPASTQSNWTAIGADAATSTNAGNGQFTAIGYRAGQSNVSGGRWVAIGTEAMQLSQTGEFTTAIGYRAAKKNTGGNVLAIGAYAGEENTTGTLYTAIGPSAARYNQTGSGWTAIGPSTGLYNLTGSNWTAVGRDAGLSNTTGNNWVAIGISAGRSNTTGSSWVAIGGDAGRYITGTTSDPLEYFENSTYIGLLTKGTNGTVGTPTNNETVIGYAAQGRGSNTVTIGNGNVTDNYFNGDIHAQGSGNGIIVTSPDGTVTRRIGIDNSGALSITTV